MPPVNLANVNISLQQFQDISSGKYNAGEISLASETTLGKVNNHVHRTGKNVVALSHHEVLAIKDAFVRALSQGGVAADEIARVRKELGLEPDGATDTALAQRSITPLSRQQVRKILDRNADTLNDHDDHLAIVTEEANHIGYSERTRANIARTRNQVNAALMKSRALLPDRRIADVQTLIGGAVHFATAADRQRLIAAAERQKTCILERSHGNPSQEPGAVLRYPIPETGQTLEFPLGTSEADYLKKLDDLLTQMRGERQPNDATMAVREQFRAAAAAGPRAVTQWLDSLANDPAGAFKARTIAVGILYDGGIDDFETLSLANRLSDADALALVRQLASHQGALKGDALLQDPGVAEILARAGQQPAPADRQAYVPALSAREANHAAYVALTTNQGVPTHEMKTMADAVVAEFRDRYGAEAVPEGVKFSSLVTPQVFADALDLENDIRRPIEDVKATTLLGAAPDVAKRYLQAVVKPMLQAAGGIPAMAVGVTSALFVRHPELRDRLVAARSPAEAQAAIDEFRPQIEAGVRRQAAVDRFRVQAKTWYREELAAGLGVPVASLEGRDVNLRRLSTKSNDLGHDIFLGQNEADSDAQIEQAFRDLARRQAQERIALMRQIDELPLRPSTRDVLKQQALSLEKVTGIDLRTLLGMAADISVKPLLDAIERGAPNAEVFEKMGVIGLLARQSAGMLAGQELGADESAVAANLIVALALDKEPGLLDAVRAFFLKPDVADVQLASLEGPASRAVAFQIFKPEQPAAESNAALADAIVDITGRRAVAPIHAQALYLAMDDLGIGDLLRDEKANLLLGNPGEAIARAVRASAKPVTPSELRVIARMNLAHDAARILATRHAAALAGQLGLDPAVIADFAEEVVYNRTPGLRHQVENALFTAAANGRDPQETAEALLAPFEEAFTVALRSFAAVRDASAGALETAVREIAERAHLDENLVREKLDGGALRDALNFLRADVRDQLSDPATDLAAWDPGALAARAAERIEDFIAKKVAFLAEVVALPVSDAAKGSLVVATLRENVFKDAELAAAAGRALRDDQVVKFFDYAKAILAPEKVAEMRDEDVYEIFQNVAERLHAAIEAALPEEKRAAMGHDDHAAVRALVAAAFVDHCGDTLLRTVSAFLANGRLDKVQDVADAVHRKHAADHITFETGRDPAGREVPVDLEAAARANRGAAAAALVLRLLDAATVALDDAWLPADLADAVNANRATPVQKAVADAAVKRAPALFERYAAGLDGAKAARLKSFAISLDYRDHALATTEEILRAAADALRAAPNAEAAEARLAELVGGLFRPEDAAAAVAAAAQASGIALDEAQTAKAVALVAEFGAGMPVKNAGLLARFVTSLRLTDRSAELDRRRVAFLAPQLAGWRDFQLADPGKEALGGFFKDEANALLREYLRPDQASQFANDVFKTMSVDAGRGVYTIAGTRFDHGPGPAVLGAFNGLNLPPAAKRALSVLMSQASALPILDLQMKIPEPPNDGRPVPFDASALPGAGEFVSRGISTEPGLFLAQQMMDRITSIFDLTISEDGRTATLKIVKGGQMLVGTDDDKMATHFGSAVVEEELTIDIASDPPTVRSVRVSQRFDASDDLKERYLQETAPIPPPPQNPPDTVPVL